MAKPHKTFYWLSIAINNKKRLLVLKGAWGEMGEGLEATEGKRHQSWSPAQGRTSHARVRGQGSCSPGLPRSQSSPGTQPCPQHPGNMPLLPRSDPSCRHRRCRVLAQLLRAAVGARCPLVGPACSGTGEQGFHAGWEPLPSSAGSVLQANASGAPPEHSSPSTGQPGPPRPPNTWGLSCCTQRILDEGN